jgi:cytidine deaminase
MLSLSPIEDQELDTLRRVDERCALPIPGAIRPTLEQVLNRMPPFMAGILTSKLQNGGWPAALRLTPKDVQDIQNASTISWREISLLMLGLGTALSRTTDPAQQVAAVIEAGSGALYLGIRLDWQAAHIRLSLHSVQTALLSAWNYGETSIKSLLVETLPCAACRQTLRETPSWPTLKLSVAQDGLYSLDSGAITEHALSRRHLREVSITGGLLRPPKRRFTIRHRDNELAELACRAAELSYAPYSQNFAGVALRTAQGTVHAGRYAEIGVSSLSILAIEMALVDLALAGRDTVDVAEIVLVESRGKVAQFSLTQDVAHLLGDVPFEFLTATPAQ